MIHAQAFQLTVGDVVSFRLSIQVKMLQLTVRDVVSFECGDERTELLQS